MCENFDLISTYYEYHEPERIGWELLDLNATYYLINAQGGVAEEPETNDSFDRQAYQAANYFSTKEKAEEINLKQTLFRKLQRFSDENGGNEIDWNDVTQGKFYLWYHAEQRQIKVDRTLTIRAFGQVYFRSEEVAQRAIETFQEDFIQCILLMSSTEKA